MNRFIDYEDQDDMDDDFGYYQNNPRFMDPGGSSALRAGKREYPCPTCGTPNVLCAEDVQRGYQCDSCADAQEGGWEY